MQGKIIRFVIILVLCIKSKPSFSQTSFVMSAVGNYAGTSATSNAILFKSIATCIDVQTGIAVLKGERGTGDFAINCEVVMKFNTLGVKLYPNPVQDYTKLKLNNTPPLTEVFNVSIWNTDGFLISNRKETGYDLFQGISINLADLHAGTYVLKIESTKYVDAIKFVKAN